MRQNDFLWLDVPVEAAARRLLGCELVSEIGGAVVRARIVETEAYDEDDEASHTFRGRTARNDAMFLGAGHLYVYLSYGLHHCCNVVCGPKGFGCGVLIRAVEPLEGIATVEQRRRTTGVNASNGPGKVCQALGIGLSLSGHDLAAPPVRLIERPPLGAEDVGVGPRIGISKAVDRARRFWIADNPYVSKKVGRTAS